MHFGYIATHIKTKTIRKNAIRLWDERNNFIVYNGLNKDKDENIIWFKSKYPSIEFCYNNKAVMIRYWGWLKFDKVVIYGA